MDFAELFSDLWQVTLVGILLGAGPDLDGEPADHAVRQQPIEPGLRGAASDVQRLGEGAHGGPPVLAQLEDQTPIQVIHRTHEHIVESV